MNLVSVFESITFLLPTTSHLSCLLAITPSIVMPCYTDRPRVIELHSYGIFQQRLWLRYGMQ